MNSQIYCNVEDIYAAIRKISAALTQHEQLDAARELNETINNYWTTSSEALGETRLILLSVRPVVEKYLEAAMLRLLDEAARAANDLWHGKPA